MAHARRLDGGRLVEHPPGLARGAVVPHVQHVLVPRAEHHVEVAVGVEIGGKRVEATVSNLSVDGVRLDGGPPLGAPVLSAGDDYEGPDTDGAYTITWQRPEGAAGEAVLQDERQR